MPGIKTTRIICTWSDIVGFGAKCAEHNWNLNQLKTRKVLGSLQNEWKALKDSQNTFYLFGDQYIRNELWLGVNDGVVRNLDIPKTANDIDPLELGHYICSLARAHDNFNSATQKLGFPGIITVSAVGQRVINEGEPEWYDKELYKRLPPEKPIDFNSYLHFNTGFSFAYLVENTRKQWKSEVGGYYITKELKNLLTRAGFKKRKWSDTNIALVYERIRDVVSCENEEYVEYYEVTIVLEDPIPISTKIYKTDVYRVRLSEIVDHSGLSEVYGANLFDPWEGEDGELPF